MNVLQIRNVKKAFGTQQVLQGVNLDVPEHKIYGFIGQNGAGKTTTMRAILSLLPVDEGSMEVCGEMVAYGNTKTNRFLGYLSDVPEFYGYMTPSEYLALCGNMTGMKKEQIQKRSKELLTLVGLQTSSKKRIQGFSRGMKQRLGIAQALFNEPKLLICDEPTSALDPLGRKDILDILAKVKEHTTVLFSTHILSDVERICDEVAILHKGVIQVHGNIEDLKKTKAADTCILTFVHQKDIAPFLAAFDFHDVVRLDLHSIQIKDANIYALQQAMLTYITKHNIPIAKLEMQEPTLEDVFMEVVNA